MSAIVRIDTRDVPKHAVDFADIEPLVRLAGRNAMRRVEYAGLAGESPREQLDREQAALRRLLKAGKAYLMAVEECLKKGHAFNGDDLCNRCGADGRA